jgi:glycosyltransferase involved in cell wall biosynthesis
LLAVVGNLKVGMAVSELLTAMRDLPPHVHLALVGAGYDTLDGVIDGFRLGSRVHRFGPLAPTHVVPFLRTADISPILYQPLNANFVFALPNKFFQAVAAGVPVLYPSDLPEMRAIIERHGCGLPIVPSDPSSLAAAVRLLLDDRDELQRLRAAAERARAILTWEREEAVLTPLFAELVPVLTPQ